MNGSGYGIVPSPIPPHTLRSNSPTHLCLAAYSSASADTSQRGKMSLFSCGSRPSLD